MTSQARRSRRLPRTRGADWAYAFQILRQESDGRVFALATFALLLVLAASAMAALAPLLLKVIVDHLTAIGTQHGAHFAIAVAILGYAGTRWCARTLGELRSLIIGRIDQRLGRLLSLRLFKHIMALPLRYHRNNRAGALNQTLANSLVGYRMVLQHLVTTVLPVLLEISMMSAVLLALGHPVFLAIIVSTLCCYFTAFFLGAVQLTAPARAASSAHIDASALMTDNILNYETVKALCLEAHTHQRMDNALAQTERHWIQLYSRKALNGTVIGTIFALSLGVSIYVAARAVQRGQMTIGDFVLVNTYLLQIFSPMEMLGYAFRDISQGVAFIEKMIAILQKTPEKLPIASCRPLPQGDGRLDFEAVSFSYDSKQPILQDITFAVAAGRTVALVGASGSGKSTLIRLLVRFWEPDSGRILIDGVSITELLVSSLRRAVAIVPQDTVLFNESIAYNIAVGRPNSSFQEIVEAAKLAHIHDSIMARPKGYQTLVGDRGLKLSGGELQRIAIARATLKRPRIFVFDEATSSLDSRTERSIVTNLREISRQTTTIVVAHRLSTIVAADEILVLQCGRIAERGTHTDLLRRHGVYHDIWSAQTNDYNDHVAEVV